MEIKKDNVLKAFKNAEHFPELEDAIKDLFPEAFEEEKKESELEKILIKLLADGWIMDEDKVKNTEPCIEFIAKAKQQIIDLACKKVDECSIPRYSQRHVNETMEKM